MFAEKIVLITGSSRRSGLGITEDFAMAGANIVLNGMGDAAEVETTGARLARTLCRPAVAAGERGAAFDPAFPGPPQGQRVKTGRLMLRQLLLCLAFLAAGAPTAALAETKNGFDLRGALIPVEEIHFGGPAKDGIPSIDKPAFVAASKASFLRGADGVLGLEMGGGARAYPTRILDWHEVVNDVIGSDPVVITYCPLCGTGVAFERRVDGRVLDFGVSGLLYNSDVLLYDRQTQSLWSQLMGQAISGPLKGQKLTMLPLTHTTWADWRKSHPATRLLSTKTGQTRPYGRDAYLGYASDEDILFPVAFRAAGYHPKERVLGIRIGADAKAYPFVELTKTGGTVADRIGDTTLTIRFDREAARATAHTADGRQLPAVVGYWFAWYAFNPNTAVFRAAEQRRP